MAPQRCRAGTRLIASVLLFVALLLLVNLLRRLEVTPKRNSGERYREESATARAHVAQRLAAGERFITFKELTINNGLSNAYNALRSALAIASLTNRTLILPRYFSRHLRSEPYDVDAGYFFDEDALRKRFRVEAASLVAHAFPNAMAWPPLPPLRVHWIQLHEGEQLCGECSDSAKMESLGLVESTCPPLALRGEQLVTVRASESHLGASEAQLRQWLQPYAKEPLLLLGRAFRRFFRFESDAEHLAFRARLQEGLRAAPQIRAAAEASLGRLRAMAGPRGRFDCVHMRRRDFLADHAGEEASVGEYARLAAKRLLALRRDAANGGAPQVGEGDTGAGGGGGGSRTGKARGAKAKRARPGKRWRVSGGRRLLGGEAGGARGDELDEGATAPSELGPVYLTSDVSEVQEVRTAFERHFETVLTIGQVFPPEQLDSFGSFEHTRLSAEARAEALAVDMRFGSVEQLLCSEADTFVGNLWSTFTHHICHLRELRGVRGACRGSDVYGRAIDPRTEFV